MADTPDLKELMQMAQKMQKSMKEAHDDLARQKYRGVAGAGLVTVIMDGKHESKEVILDPKVKLESLGTLADLIIAANNAAVREIEKASERKMMDLTKELGLPPAGGTGSGSLE